MKSEGRWSLHVEECAKMLEVCYFQLHRALFETAYPDWPAELFRCRAIGGDVRKIIDAVRETIFMANGANGKKHCPHWDALLLHAHKAGMALEYWQSARHLRAPSVSYEGRRWGTANGKSGEKITKNNVCHPAVVVRISRQERPPQAVEQQLPASHSRETPMPAVQMRQAGRKMHRRLVQVLPGV